jgi:hypothetical protein
MADPGIVAKLRLSPMQRMAMVSEYDVTLGGSHLIVGNHRTIESLQGKGLVSSTSTHPTGGWQYLIGTLSPTGEEVRSALLGDGGGG